MSTVQSKLSYESSSLEKELMALKQDHPLRHEKAHPVLSDTCVDANSRSSDRTPLNTGHCCDSLEQGNVMEEVVIDGFSILSFKTEDDLLHYTHQSETERSKNTAPLTDKLKRSRRGTSLNKRRHRSSQLIQQPATSASVNGHRTGMADSTADCHNGYLMPDSDVNSDVAQDLSCKSGLPPPPPSSGSPAEPLRSEPLLSNALNSHLTPLSTSWTKTPEKSIASPPSPSGSWKSSGLLGRKNGANNTSPPAEQPMTLPRLDDSPGRPSVTSSDVKDTSTKSKPSTCHLFSVAALTDKLSPIRSTSPNRNTASTPREHNSQSNLEKKSTNSSHPKLSNSTNQSPHNETRCSPVKHRKSPKGDLSKLRSPVEPVLNEESMKHLMGMKDPVAERLLNQWRFDELYSKTMAALAGADAKTPSALRESILRSNCSPIVSTTVPISTPVSSSLIPSDHVTNQLFDKTKNLLRPTATASATVLPNRRNKNSSNTSRNSATTVTASNPTNLLHSAASRISNGNPPACIPSVLPPPPPLIAGPSDNPDLQKRPQIVAPHHYPPPPPLYGVYQQPRPVLAATGMQQLLSNHDSGGHGSSLTKLSNTGRTMGAPNPRLADPLSYPAKHPTPTSPTNLSQQAQRMLVPPVIPPPPYPGPSGHHQPSSVLPAERSKLLPPTGTSLLFRPTHLGRVYSRWADGHIRIARYIQHRRANTASRTRPPNLTSAHSKPPVRPIALPPYSPLLSHRPSLPGLFLPPVASSSVNSNPMLSGHQHPWPSSSLIPPSTLTTDKSDEKNIFLNYLLTGLLSHIPQNGQRLPDETNGLAWQSTLQRLQGQAPPQPLTSTLSSQSNAALTPKDLSTTSKVPRTSQLSVHPTVSPAELEAKRRRLESCQPTDLSNRLVQPVLPSTAPLLNRFPPHPMNIFASGIPKPETMLNAASNSFRFPGLLNTRVPQMGLDVSKQLGQVGNLNLGYTRPSHPIPPW